MTPETLTALVNAAPQFAVLVGVLAWFMWKTDQRLGRIETAIDLLSRAVLLDIVSRTEGPVREQANQMIRELDNLKRGAA